MTWLLLVLLTLAVYRVSHMLAYEDGPFDVFARMRGAVGQASWIGRGLHCVLCLSFWLSLVVFFLLYPVVGVVMGVVAWQAVAGGVLVLHKVLK